MFVPPSLVPLGIGGIGLAAAHHCDLLIRLLIKWVSHDQLERSPLFPAALVHLFPFHFSTFFFFLSKLDFLDFSFFSAQDSPIFGALSLRSSQFQRWQAQLLGGRLSGLSFCAFLSDQLRSQKCSLPKDDRKKKRGKKFKMGGKKEKRENYSTFQATARFPLGPVSVSPSYSPQPVITPGTLDMEA